MSLSILWTAKSSNVKVGKIPVSTTSKETCAPSCPFAGNGCYAESGPLAFLWKSLTNAGPNADFKSGVASMRSTDWAGLCDNVAALPEGQLWRHNQAGDLPHTFGQIDDTKLADLVGANHGRRGFTYTHHSMDNPRNRELVAYANREGFTVNVSANNLEHADKVAALDVGPVVTVLPADVGGRADLKTPEGRKVVVCPATYLDNVSCASCGLCAVAKRKVIVGFPAHGARKGAASKVAA